MAKRPPPIITLTDADKDKLSHQDDRYNSVIFKISPSFKQETENLRIRAHENLVQLLNNKAQCKQAEDDRDACRRRLSNFLMLKKAVGASQGPDDDDSEFIARVQGLSAEIATANAQVTARETELASTKEQLSTALEALLKQKSIQDALDKSIADSERYNAETRTTEEKLQASEQSIAECKSDLAKELEKVAACEGRIAHLKTSLNKGDLSSDEDLISRLSEEEGARQGLITSVAEITAKLAAKEGALTQTELNLQMAQEKLTQCNEEATALKQRLESMDALKTSSVSAVQAQVDKNQELQTQLLDSRKGLAAMTAERDECFADINAEFKNVSDCEERIHHIKGSFDQGEFNDEDFISNMLRIVKVQKDAASASEAAVAELQARLVSVTAEMEALKMRDTDLEAERTRTMESLSKAELHSSEISSRLHDCEMRKVKLGEEITSLNDAISQLHQEAASQTANTATAEMQENSNQNRIQQLELKLTEAEEQYHQQLQVSEELKIQVPGLETNVQDHTQAMSALKELFETSSEDYSRLRETADRLETDLNTARAETKTCKVYGGTLVQSLQKCTDEKTSLKSQLVTFTERKDALETELSELMQAHHECTMKAQTCGEETSHLAESITDLERQIVGLNAAVNAKEAIIVSEMSKLRVSDSKESEDVAALQVAQRFLLAKTQEVTALTQQRNDWNNRLSSLNDQRAEAEAGFTRIPTVEDIFERFEKVQTDLSLAIQARDSALTQVRELQQRDQERSESTANDANSEVQEARAAAAANRVRLEQVEIELRAVVIRHHEQVAAKGLIVEQLRYIERDRSTVTAELNRVQSLLDTCNASLVAKNAELVREQESCSERELILQNKINMLLEEAATRASQRQLETQSPLEDLSLAELTESKKTVLELEELLADCKEELRDARNAIAASSDRQDIPENTVSTDAMAAILDDQASEIHELALEYLDMTREFAPAPEALNDDDIETSIPEEIVGQAVSSTEHQRRKAQANISEMRKIIMNCARNLADAQQELAAKEDIIAEMERTIAEHAQESSSVDDGAEARSIAAAADIRALQRRLHDQGEIVRNLTVERDQAVTAKTKASASLQRALTNLLESDAESEYQTQQCIEDVAELTRELSLQTARARRANVMRHQADEERRAHEARLFAFR